MTSFLEFYEKLHPMGCFSVYQARAIFPSFDRNNLRRWVSKGQLLHIKKEWYAFPDFLQTPDSSRFIAGRIYNPSYISLHSALSFYGMIPESVVQITSVSTLKTAKFENAFGQFSYQNVKKELFFGYKPMLMSTGQSWNLAHPEKALLDLLYLFPFYRSEDDMLELRLDEDFMTEDFNKERFNEYLAIANSQALEQRAKLLLKTYDL